MAAPAPPAITGAWVALNDCFAWMMSRSIISINPLKDHVAAISCGIYRNTPVLDLDYAEDSTAETDANFVITGKGGIVEIQGTAEGKPFLGGGIPLAPAPRARVASSSLLPCRSR